jgi:DnaJ-class molecular chaperone
MRIVMAILATNQQALDVLRILLGQIEPCYHCDGSSYELYDENMPCPICCGQGETLDATRFISQIRDVLRNA